jgi:hypothetical protein
LCDLRLPNTLHLCLAHALRLGLGPLATAPGSGHAAAAGLTRGAFWPVKERLTVDHAQMMRAALCAYCSSPVTTYIIACMYTWRADGRAG